MTSQEIYEVMESHWATFKENHDRFTDKKVKAAGVRARKAINELKKLFMELKAQNCSMLISTHIIDSIEGYWDRVFIMNKSKIVKIILIIVN